MQWGAKTAASGTGQQPASKAASVQFYLVSQLGADLSWRLQLAACSCSANLLALKVRIAPFKGCQACLQRLRHSMRQNTAHSLGPCSLSRGSCLPRRCSSKHLLQTYPCTSHSLSLLPAFCEAGSAEDCVALSRPSAQLQSLGITAVSCSRYFSLTLLYPSVQISTVARLTTHAPPCRLCLLWTFPQHSLIRRLHRGRLRPARPLTASRPMMMRMETPA